MTIDHTNGYAAALDAIKRTPIGESGTFCRIAFFRDAKRQVALIQHGRIDVLPILRAAEELVRRNLIANEGA